MYLFNKSRMKSPRQRLSRRRATPRKDTPRKRRISNKKPICPQCKAILGEKIGHNIREGRFVSRAQSIAVAYNQTKKEYSRCRRCFARSDKK